MFYGSKFIILILRVDDFLLARNNKVLLHETKLFLCSHFEIKDFGEVTFVLVYIFFEIVQKAYLDFYKRSRLKRCLKDMTCIIVHLMTYLYLEVTNLTCSNVHDLNLK